MPVGLRVGGDSSNMAVAQRIDGQMQNQGKSVGDGECLTQKPTIWVSKDTGWTQPEAQKQLEELCLCVGLKDLEPEIEMMESLASIDEKLSHKKSLPHLAVFMAEQSKISSLRRIFAALHACDPALCILLVTEGQVSGKETMNWLDAGATAIISRDFKASQITEPLQEVMARRLGIHKMRQARIPAKHKVQIRISSLEQAMVSETLNLGLGGMFVRKVPAGVLSGDLIEFDLQFSDSVSESSSFDSGINSMLARMDGVDGSGSVGNLKSIVGQGIEVWVRQMADSNLPEGIGIQFSDLPDQTRKVLNDFIKCHGIKSYIPKA